MRHRHDDVGNDHDLNRGHQMRGGFDAILTFLVLRDQQLGRDHQQREATDQFEVRQLHQRRDDTGEDDAQDNSGTRAEDHDPAAKACRYH